MRTIIAVSIATLLATAVFITATLRQDQTIRNIGSRLELFVDDWLVDSIKGSQLVLHRPVPREIVLQIDQPWEKNNLKLLETEHIGSPFGCAAVMKDGDVFRMYYTWDAGKKLCPTGYAESRDGIRWTKPSLGIIEFNGSMSNNLIWAESRVSDFNAFRDPNPQASPEERYKALAGDPPLAFVSVDALHWKKLRQEQVITDGAFDSQNVAFWDSEHKQYVAYYRDFYPLGITSYRGSKMDEKKVNRDIKRATSKDFIHWTQGEWLSYGEVPREHFYTNAIAPYFRAPHLYLGFPMRFLPDRKKVAEHPDQGVSDQVFISSRDGRRWDRRFMEAFVYPGLDRQNWTDRNFIAAWGSPVPTSTTEMSVYWVEHFRHTTNRVRRGTLRIDGITSLYAGFEGGEVITHPLMFQGNSLMLNYATSAVGSVRVEVLEASGEPIVGLSGEATTELYGDSVLERYRWQSSVDLGQWAGKPVRLRLHLKDAHLYSLQFQPSHAGE